MISPLKRKARHPPFVMAFKAIVRNPKLSQGARLLLLILKSYSDSSGLYCYPSHETLAHDFGCSVPTIKRLVTELRKAGMISTAQRRNKDGRTSSTAYLLDDERRAKLLIVPKKRPKPGITSDPPSVSPVIPGEASKIVDFTEKRRDFI